MQWVYFRQIAILRLVLGLWLISVLVGIDVSPTAARGSQITASPRPEIAQAVDDRQLASLQGHVRAEANAVNDRGAVADSFTLPHMLLQLKRSPALEQALEQLIDQLHDPSSPNFHHWLTPSEFGTRFGVAAEDRQTITTWLRQRGFTVNFTYPNGTLIDFSGTAGQVRAAFHTQIHRLAAGGETHFANMSDPQIPAALASVVTGIVGLHDFKPHRQYHPRSNYTVGDGRLLVAPADMATIYNINPLFNAGVSGQGQTIVVIEDTNVYSTADWATFRSTFGLSSYTSGSFTQIHPEPPSGHNNCSNPPPNNNGDEGEAILDAEWASAAAPSATIQLASCDNTPDGLLIAIQNLINGATPPPIISVSYGECEAQNTNTASYNAAYQQAVAEGVSVFVASGDWGAAVCDASSSSPPAATSGIGVNALASSPYDVAVGGTDFEDTFNGNQANYWSANNSSTFGSARSYIPEIPWNDSCASTLIARFFTANSTTYGSGGFCNSATGANELTIIAGSGGPSKIFGKPSWQAGFAGIQNDGVRDLPDVSLFAGNGAWSHYYVFCWSDPAQTTNDAHACRGAPSNWSGAGGTSFAAPILAGIQALVNQQNGGAQGNPNPVYYALAKSEYGTGGNASCNSAASGGPASSCIFDDISQGDDDVPCTGTDNCYLPSGTYGVLSTSNNDYAPAFVATTGWDFASGIGSINANNLVHGWKVLLSVSVTGNGIVTSAPAGISCGSNCSASFVAGQQVTLAATPVSGSIFNGWSGACNGSAGCVVTMNGAQSVTATFAASSYQVTVSLDGSGNVVSSPPGINCGGESVCAATFPAGQQIELISTAAQGWVPLGWTQSCAGTASTCFFTLNAPLSQTAHFGTTINVSVSGNGTVISSLPNVAGGSGIFCSQSHQFCTAAFPVGQQVTLTAQLGDRAIGGAPPPGLVFYGWGGACSGGGSCVITMNGTQVGVSATFLQLGAQSSSSANLWAYTCNGTAFDNLNGALAGVAAWTSTTSASAAMNGNRGQPNAGDLIEITNTCLGDVAINTNNLTLTNHNDITSAGSDGIIGQVEFVGVNGALLRNLVIQGPASGGFAPGTSNFTGNEVAMVYAHDGAAVTLQSATIYPGPVDGVAIALDSTGLIRDTTITPVNTAYASAITNGITVSDASSIFLGQSDGSHANSISNNYNGYGIALYRKASADIFGSTISGNQRGQIFGTAGSAIHAAGNFIAQSGASSAAIQVIDGSTLILDMLDNGTGNTINGNAGGAVVAIGHSVVLLRTATLSASNAGQPTVEVSGNSSMLLAGGNAITNIGGMAIQVDHTASVMQTTGPRVGYSPALPDSFSGSGLVELQSSLDIGQGYLPNTSTSSFTWAVPWGNCVLVQQNSALRVSGGVAFVGAAPSSCSVNGGDVSSTIVLAQESNIFININQGGTNTISGGGAVTCSFSSMPNEHVTGAKNITPNVVPIGGWSNVASATSPVCLGP